MSARLALLILCMAGPAAAGAAGPTPRPGPPIDIEKFTVGGVGLLSAPEEVRDLLGAPEEEQTLSAIVEEKDANQLQKEREEEDELETRPPAAQQARLTYAYFRKGIKVTFLADTKKVETIDVYVKGLPPYERYEGSFVQPIPIEVREQQLLRPLASQIYKDAPHTLYLKRDSAAPRRQCAVLAFSPEGWLTRVTFLWEENYALDLDRLCVAGVCLGDDAESAPARLGPPDKVGGRGRDRLGKWQREGIRLYAGRRDGKIRRIVVSLRQFDGGCVQPISLSGRKEAFHDLLKDRIYQESSVRICAYRKGEPLSPGKLVLNFDEDDRLQTAVFETAENVELDLEGFALAGIRVGDPVETVRRILKTPSKWRRSGRTMILGYPRQGVRVHLALKNPDRKGPKAARFDWAECGEVKKVDTVLTTSIGLYATPYSLADTKGEYEKKAARRIFSKKYDTVYLSRDGKPPSPGPAAVIDFEKIGWPQAVTLREFQDIAVDMKAFSVAGITIGTHADEVLRTLGKPDRSRVIERDNLQVLRYIEKGVVVVVNTLDRSVCKITIQMDRFEGSFVQNLTPDSNADEFEKAVYPEIYKQDEKHFWLSPDGGVPTWKEGVVTFGLAGDVDTISFLTLAVKKEGILLDITRELE